ncbi:hypothetical protein CPB85DRAFT_840510 [Mucidula mucida]|nr:hypothetical protein CPB85DRAFT_840510 [Mucidula mucida]
MLFRDLQTTINELRGTTDDLKAERDALLEEKNVLQSTVDILKADQKNRDVMSDSLENTLRAQLEVVEAEKDKLSTEKYELQQQVEHRARSSGQEQNALKTLAEKYASLQQEKDALLIRNAELEKHSRDSNASDRDAFATRLQTELEAGEKDKQLDGLKVQVATLQEQCETLRTEKIALAARMEDLETAGETETVQQLENQLVVYKRKLGNARKHTVSVRTSSQRTFANVHLALTRLQHGLASAVGSDQLERSVKRHVKELRKLRERVEEETPGTVDAIMGVSVKREEEDEEDEEDEVGGGGGNEEGEEEEEGRPRKRTRLDS